MLYKIENILYIYIIVLHVGQGNKVENINWREFGWMDLRAPEVLTSKLRGGFANSLGQITGPFYTWLV
jgi:hypothetical protein